MKNITSEQMRQWFAVNHPELKFVPISIDSMVFKKRNKLLCFYCGRYNNKWTCPPKIPDIDYQQMFSEYERMAFVYFETNCKDNYDEARTYSTVFLHKALLHAESYLLNEGNSTRICFIGGSCKLCKNGCATDKCRNPYMARIPLEATGVDVVESSANVGIDISFPADNKILRIGLLLW